MWWLIFCTIFWVTVPRHSRGMFCSVLLAPVRGTWDLKSPSRDQTHTPCPGRWSLNHWAVGVLIPGQPLFWMLLWKCVWMGLTLKSLDFKSSTWPPHLHNIDGPHAIRWRLEQKKRLTHLRKGETCQQAAFRLVTASLSPGSPAWWPALQTVDFSTSTVKWLIP